MYHVCCVFVYEANDLNIARALDARQFYIVKKEITKSTRKKMYAMTR